MMIEEKVRGALTKLSFSRYGPLFTNLILMSRVKYVKDNELPFAAAAVMPMSKEIVVMVNEDVLKDCELSTITSILAHEYWHIVNGHVWYRLPDLLTDNVAADAEINQETFLNLTDLGFKKNGVDSFIRKNGVIPEKYGLPKNKSRETYYELLKKKSKSCSSRTGQSKSDQPGTGSGTIKVDDHGKWEDAEVAGSKEIYRRIVEEILQQVKSQGLLPGRIVEEIEARWRKNKTLEQLLKRLISRYYHNTVDETYSRKRPSRRFPLLPGVINGYGPKFIFAIDTSGSMSTEELEEILSVFRWCCKKFGDVELIQCDAEVHEITKNLRKNIIPIKGRGGTDFRPVFKYIKEKYKNKIDMLIFGTDTLGTFPEEPPPYKVVWVVPSQAEKITVPFGTVVKL